MIEERKGTIFDDLKCPICLAPYNTRDKIPMVFPCGHGVCEGCFNTAMFVIEDAQ